MVGVRGFENSTSNIKLLIFNVYLALINRQSGGKWRFLAVLTATLPPLNRRVLNRI